MKNSRHLPSKRRKAEDLKVFHRLNQKNVKKQLETLAENGWLASDFVAETISSSRVSVNEADINALYKSMGYEGWGSYVLDLQKYDAVKLGKPQIISKRGRGLYYNANRKRIGACFYKGGSPSSGYSTIPSPSS